MSNKDEISYFYAPVTYLDPMILI